MDRARRRQGDPKLPLAQAWIAQLLKDASAARDAAPVALLLEGARVWYARHLPASPHEPHSAVTRLIEGVWAREPAQARAILRHRIYFTGRAGEMDHGMIEVAAKRITDQVTPALERSVDTSREAIRLGDAISSPPSARDADSARKEAEALLRTGVVPIQVAVALARQAAPRRERHVSDRAVGAIALGPQGELLGAAFNRNGQDRTRHAELVLAQDIWARTGRPLPAGTRVFTSLKCCAMCAGTLWQLAEDPARLSVHFAWDDPGPCAAHTVLQPGTHDRARASAQRPELRDLRIEFGPELPADSR